MSVENGEWIMHGVDWSHSEYIHSVEELENYISEIGFLPLFGNGVSGFSVEEWTDPRYWWTDIESIDGHWVKQTKEETLSDIMADIC